MLPNQRITRSVSNRLQQVIQNKQTLTKLNNLTSPGAYEEFKEQSGETMLNLLQNTDTNYCIHKVQLSQQAICIKTLENYIQTLHDSNTRDAQEINELKSANTNLLAKLKEQSGETMVNCIHKVQISQQHGHIEFLNNEIQQLKDSKTRDAMN